MANGLAKLVSDLHLELCIGSKGLDEKRFEVLRSVLANDTEADTLIIAGDLCKAKLLTWFSDNLPFDEYDKVIYVPGNHEYWGTTIDKSERYLTDFSDCYDNLILLRNDWARLGNMLVYGMTYWYNGLSPLDIWQMKQSLNDYKNIRTDNYRKTDPEFFQLLSLESEQKFFSWAADKDNILLVTHHPTSRLFRTASEPNYPGYGSIMNFPVDFDTSRIKLQCHGHVHIRKEYKSEYDIPTFVNACGYIGFEKVNKQPTILTYEV